MAGVAYVQKDSSLYGIYVNSAWMMIIAMFISSYLYYTLRQDFQNHCVIAQKNAEIMEKSAELDFIANHDSLTGLLNRRFLSSWLPGIIAAKQLVGILMIDIDDFKSYNDAYGHFCMYVRGLIYKRCKGWEMPCVSMCENCRYKVLSRHAVLPSVQEDLALW